MSDDSAHDGALDQQRAESRERRSVEEHRRPVEGRSFAALDRRGLLRSLGGGAFAFGVARTFGVGSVFSAPAGTVDAATALVRREPAEPTSLESRTREVPADWHAAVTRAFAVHDRLTSVAVPGYLGSAVVPGPHERASARISVRIEGGSREPAFARIESFLAGLGAADALLDGGRDGLDVTVEALEAVHRVDQMGPREPHLLAGREHRSSGIPGGIYCETTAHSATLTPAIYRRGDDRAWFGTAGHAVTGSGDPVGDRVTLPRSDGDPLEIGRVVEIHRDSDLALVEPADGLAPRSAIQGASGDRVVGQYTRIGLADLAARGESLEKVGAQTRRTVGEIHGVDGISCLTDGVCRRGQLMWADEGDVIDGDSGAVSYHPDPDVADGLLVASITNARTWWPGQNFAWGVAAYELESAADIHF